MASLTSWLSPNVMHALGWALIHSLWQCLAVAALAAALMAFSRRPSIRYLVGVGALVLMLAAPVATFFVLVKSAAVHAPLRVPFASFAATVPAPGTVALSAIAPPSVTTVASPVSTVPPAVGNGAIKALENSADGILSPNVLPWLVAAWLCGVAFFSLRFAGGFLLLEHKRRNQSVTASTRILALCQEVQRQLGLDRAIRYLECGWLQAPAVIGWIRPIVLLPVAALTGLSEEQLRAVIAHELAHIRRLDSYVNLFQILVETLLFYHPAMWWLNKCIRAQRELCCDEIAVSLTGNRLEYAKAVTLMAEWERAPILAMAANRGPLSERIVHILGRKPASAGQRMLGLTGSVLFLIAALAAANALVEIAAPPIAQAKESVKAALLASQTTVDHLARQVFRASEPAIKLSTAQTASRTDSTVLQAAPDQREVSRDAQDQKLVPPAVDLSVLPPVNALTTPTVLASSSPPAMTQNNQPAALGIVPPVTTPAEPKISSATAADAPSSPPRPKTEAALRCLLGFGPDGCWRRFENPYARQAIEYCAGQSWYVGVEGGSLCPSGPLESIEYLGTNETGDDVYSIRLRHENDTYILPLPSPNGKIATRCKFRGPLAGAVFGVCLGGHVAYSSEARVTSPAGQSRILYTRPTEGSGQASAITSDAAIKPVVMLNTPMGEGDPNTIVCRAPQRIAGSDQLGPQVCLHNYEWWKVAMNGKDVGPDGKTLIDRPTVKNPKGEGDPDAVTCRTPQFVGRGQRTEVCRTNRFWSDLVKNQLIVDADGVVRPRPRIQNSGFGTEAPPPGSAYYQPPPGLYVGPSVAAPYPITP